MNINKTYTLRYIKLPPLSIAVGKPFDIIFSLTDDLGLEVPAYPDLLVAFSVENSEGPLDGFTAQDSMSGSNTVKIGSSKSSLHKHSITVKSSTIGRNVKVENAYLVIRVVGQVDEAQVHSLDSASSGVLEFVQTPTAITLEEEVIGLVVPSWAGPLMMLSQRDKAHSSERVTTTEVLLRGKELLRIVERPLDKIIGDHLWHGSVILSQAILQGHLSLPDADNVVEVGAGCGLVSMAVGQMSEGRRRSIIATDLGEVVTTTLTDTLAACGPRLTPIEPASLEWGNSEDTARLLEALPNRDALWILAADVLYNPASHDILLQTLLLLSEPFKHRTVTIAYRPRTDGDDGFFQIAKECGLPFQLVWQLADVQIWQHSSGQATR